MRGRARAASLVVLLATALGFVVAVPHFRFTTEITHFLPDDAADGGARVAALLAESEGARILVVDLTLGPGHESPERLRALAAGLMGFLRARPDVASVRSGFGETEVAATLDFLGSWSPTTFLPRSSYTDAELHTRLTELRDRLGGPAGILWRRTAPRDPLGGIWEPLAALRQAQGAALLDEEGILTTTLRDHAFLFVETRASPFDSAAQRAFRATLTEWLARSAPSSARLQTAGAAQFAIASEDEIKRDVNRIGIVSTIGVLALFFALFGSLRLLLLGMLPMLFGSAVAMLACHALLGPIHGITIAFGTSLLGVGIDYVEHYYTHLALDPETPATTTMRRIAPSIVLGALTTIIGFVGIGAAGVRGLREMALFSTTAILASIAATYWLIPPWIPARYRPPPTLAAARRMMHRLLEHATRRRGGASRIAVALGAVVAIALGLRGLSFSDNVNMLVSEHGPHVTDEREVRSRLGPEESSSFAVVTGADEETLLTALAVVTAELEAAQRAGAVTAFVPLGRLLPSRGEQQARFIAAQAAAPALRRMLVELDFVPEQFQPYWSALAAPQPSLLTLAELRRSPLGAFLGAWFPASTTPTALIPLIGVRDLTALRALVPSATLMAPKEMVVDLFRGVRLHTLIASGVGLIAIFILLAVRYRSARKALTALAPALLACVASVASLGAFGLPLTILHVMALLLVVSMGVDFGIFFVDKAASLEEAAGTLISILTASITTILSFGLLGLSANPGLAALGITVTVGITFSLAFCVIVAWWAGRRLLVQP